MRVRAGLLSLAVMSLWPKPKHNLSRVLKFR